MQLKLSKMTLFFLCFAVLFFGEIPFGALICIALLLQLNLGQQNINLSGRSQLAAFRLFLISIPLLFFWGGTASLLKVYENESQYLFWLMAISILLMTSMILVLQLVLPTKFFLKNGFSVLESVRESYKEFKKQRSLILKLSLVIFLSAWIPHISADWKLVIAILTANWFGSRPQSNSESLLS